MEVHCAWCEKEGKPSKLKDIEGPNDQISHGICEVHQEKMLATIRASSKKNPMRQERRRRR